MFVPRSQRLFEDNLVIDLLPALTRWMIRRAWIRERFASFFDRKAPGIRGALLCRTRSIDDAVKDAISDGLRTVVILGAGLDTRAYRLPELASASVFEVDLPAVQAAKRSRLPHELPNVRFVPIDFEAERLDEALVRGGLYPNAPAIFVWEGVTQYLQPEAVDSVLRVFAARPRGSEVVFTYVLREAVTGDRYRRPEPWFFGIDPPQVEAFLKERGLALREDSGADEHIARYLRPLGRELEVSGIERVASAYVP